MILRKILLVTLVLFCFSCSASSDAKLREIDIFKGGKSVAIAKVEVADTPAERAKGLMYRKELPKNQGMWFIFDKNVTGPFWMENTFVSLDIIFIDSQNKIVSIVKDTVPLSREQISSTGPYRYVLEVNAGYSEKQSLVTGDIIILKE